SSQALLLNFMATATSKTASLLAVNRSTHLPAIKLRDVTMRAEFSSLRLDGESTRRWMLYAFYCSWNLRRGRACRELCCSRRWPCADDLRGTRESCECIRVHGMLFGQSG